MYTQTYWDNLMDLASAAGNYRDREIARMRRLAWRVVTVEEPPAPAPVSTAQDQDALQAKGMVEQYESGATLREIARTHQLSYAKARRILQSEGVEFRPRGNPSTEFDADKARAMRMEGVPIGEIASQLKTSNHRIKEVLGDELISLPRASWSEEEISRTLIENGIHKLRDLEEAFKREDAWTKGFPYRPVTYLRERGVKTSLAKLLKRDPLRQDHLIYTPEQFCAALYSRGIKSISEFQRLRRQREEWTLQYALHPHQYFGVRGWVWSAQDYRDYVMNADRGLPHRNWGPPEVRTGVDAQLDREWSPEELREALARLGVQKAQDYMRLRYLGHPEAMQMPSCPPKYFKTRNLRVQWAWLLGDDDCAVVALG